MLAQPLVKIIVSGGSEDNSAFLAVADGHALEIPELDLTGVAFWKCQIQVTGCFMRDIPDVLTCYCSATIETPWNVVTKRRLKNVECLARSALCYD